MKKTVVPALILTAICLVVVSLLALTNLLTAERIAAEEKLATTRAAQSVLSEASTLSEITEEGYLGFIGYDEEENVVGYVFVHSAKGYGGDVTAIVGVDMNGCIAGVVLKAPDETPGLGANVAKESYTSQFIGKSDASGVDAVSGATYSSKAAEAAVKAALESYAAFTEGGK